MDWGGIIAGSMAGGAKAIGEMADDTMKRRDLELAQQRAEQVAIKGEERRALLQRENAAYEMDLKLKREMADSKRDQDQTDRITDGGRQIESNRQVASMTSLRDSLPQEGEFAGQAIDPKDIANLPPAARAAYEKAGLIERASGSQQLRDQTQVAREIGASKTVRDDLRTSLTAQTAAENKLIEQAQRDRTDLRLETKDDTRHTETMEKLKIDSRRADIAASRTNSSGSGRGSSDGAKITREERLRYTTLFSDAGKRLSEAQTALAKVPMGRAGDADRESLRSSISGYKEERALYQGFLAESQAPTGAPAESAAKPATTTKPAAQKPVISSLPKGSVPIGTKDGKTVYQAPDGKKYLGN